MCMFSGSVQTVKNTRIFARRSGADRQVLAYSMAYAVDSDVAMILPLPMGSHDETTALRFIALDTYTHFFQDIAQGVPDLHFGVSRGGARMPQATLAVHQVGAYDASFVPTLEDFGRLDARFRLPETVWQQLPAYADYGFAVFKLRGDAGRHRVGWSRARAGVHEAHPIAFEFVTRWRDALFFPTVHVHDGDVHQRAQFDHHLFFQGQVLEPATGKCFYSQRLASEFMDVPRTQGLVAGDMPCGVVVLEGMLPNQDMVLSTNAAGNT